MFSFTLDVTGVLFYLILFYSFIPFHFSFISFNLLYYILMLWVVLCNTLMFWVINLRSYGVINLLSLLADGMANYCSFIYVTDVIVMEVRCY